MDSSRSLQTPDMRYLNAAEVFAIHKQIVESTGKNPIVREHGLLFSICEKPKASFGGTELYPSLFLKAAVLLEALTNYHIFFDGNKRTAWTATSVFLSLNGYHIKPSETIAFRLMLGVAKKKHDLASIQAWLKRYSVRRR